MIKELTIKESSNSVLFVKDGLVYYKSDAVIEIAKLLTGWPGLLKYIIIVPRFLRNAFYRLIAANRYRIFGKQATCMVPKEEDKDRFFN